MADTNNGLNLVRRCREHDRSRNGTEMHERVRFVDQKFGGVAYKAAWRHGGGQRLEKPGVQRAHIVGQFA
jgi:hypothetical protein